MYFAHELEIRPADKLDKRAQERLIEFNPEWIDPEGLPTRLHAWVLDNMTSGEFCYGIRWIGSYPYRFTIKRSDTEISAKRDNVNFNAKFEMRQGYSLEIKPGCIIYRDSIGEIQRKFVEYIWVGETTWKQDIEVRRINHSSYIDCPTILGHALTQIDSMVFALTKMETRRPSVLLEMLGPGYRDPTNCKATPIAIQNVYSFVRGLQGGEKIIIAPTSDETLTTFKQILKTPETLYNWVIQEIRTIATAGFRKDGEKLSLTPTSENDFGTKAENDPKVSKQGSVNGMSAVRIVGREFKDIPAAVDFLSEEEPPREYQNNWIADPKPPTE